MGGNDSQYIANSRNTIKLAVFGLLIVISPALWSALNFLMQLIGCVEQYLGCAEGIRI